MGSAFKGGQEVAWQYTGEFLFLHCPLGKINKLLNGPAIVILMKPFNGSHFRFSLLWR